MFFGQRCSVVICSSNMVAYLQYWFCLWPSYFCYERRSRYLCYLLVTTFSLHWSCWCLCCSVILHLTLILTVILTLILARRLWPCPWFLLITIIIIIVTSHPLLWWQTNCPYLHFGSLDKCDFRLLAKVCIETDGNPNYAMILTVPCAKTSPSV